MAANEKASSSKEQCDNKTNKQPSKPKDARLDFYSEHFDPFLALYTTGVKPPIPDAEPFDNLAKYRSVYIEKPPAKDSASTSTTKCNENRKKPEQLFQRRFLPSQMPIPHQRTRKNLEGKIAQLKQGPLAQLKRCRDENLRVKLWTRNDTKIRGYCCGYVSAFDLFWNVALRDVTEVFERKKHKKVPPDIHPPSTDATAAGGSQKRQGKRQNFIKFPSVRVVSETKTHEKCERYVNELLIRGEQVAFIQILQGQQ